MSTSVVTPPSAAACVPVTNPSHSVRPGSLMCTWVSTTPGTTYAVSGTRSTSPSGLVVERCDRLDPAVDDGDGGRHERAVDQHLPALHGIDPHAHARGSAGAPSRTTVASISP